MRDLSKFAARVTDENGTEVDVPPAGDPPYEPQRLLRTVLEWGTEKGHNPKPGPRLRGHQHTGAHVFVVLTHLGGGNAKAWPENKLVDEAFYDAALSEAYGLPIR